MRSALGPLGFNSSARTVFDQASQSYNRQSRGHECRRNISFTSCCSCCEEEENMVKTCQEQWQARSNDWRYAAAAAACWASGTGLGRWAKASSPRPLGLSNISNHLIEKKIQKMFCRLDYILASKDLKQQRFRGFLGESITHAHTFTHTHKHARARTHARTHAHTCAHTHTRTHT